MRYQRTIGIDLGLEGPHKAVICDEDAQVINKGYSFSTNLEEMEKLLETFVPKYLDPKQVAITMEPTGNAWFLVSSWFASKGFVVFVVKTQKVHALRRYFKKHAKTDRIDAATLGKMPFVDQKGLNEMHFAGANYFSLEKYIKARETRVNMISNEKKRVYSHMQLLNPKAMSCFGNDRFTHLAKAFYHRYANPSKVLKDGFEKFKNYLEKKAFGKADPLLIKNLFDCSVAIARFHQSSIDQNETHSPYFDKACVHALIKEHLSTIEFLEKKQKKTEKEIAKLHDLIDPEKILGKLKGFGSCIIPAAVLALTGSIKRFPNIREYLGFIGLVPSTKQSVTLAKEGTKITKAGKKILKKYYYIAAETARQFDVEFAHKYNVLTQRGLHHNQAICALANMLARRVYSLLKQKQQALDEGNSLKLQSIQYQQKDLNHKRIDSQQAREICLRDYPSKKERLKRAKEKKEKAALASISGQSHQHKDSLCQLTPQ